MYAQQKAFLPLALALACTVTSSRAADRGSDDHCAFDKAAVLALDEQSFDQDLANGGGGWRGIASKQECELIAADLIAEYRKSHGINSPILFWHEGQLRAFSGQYAQAIALFQQSHKPKGQDFGWNAYADATIAFLKANRKELESALADLLSTPAPPGENLIDGKIDLTLPDGTHTKMAWPPNVDVVQGLGRCWGKPYREAYSSSCQPTI